jgi:hypothetical protein
MASDCRSPHRGALRAQRASGGIRGVRVGTVRSSAGSAGITERRRFGAERLRGQITAVFGTEG